MIEIHAAALLQTPIIRTALATGEFKTRSGTHYAIERGLSTVGVVRNGQYIGRFDDCSVVETTLGTQHLVAIALGADGQLENYLATTYIVA